MPREIKDIKEVRLRWCNMEKRGERGERKIESE